MICSVLDIFKIAIGPSSSHTMGPMIAAGRFAAKLDSSKQLDRVALIDAEFFVSLGLTGRGHQTDRAVVLGLSGQHPSTAQPEHGRALLEAVLTTRILRVLDRHDVPFDLERHLTFHQRESLPLHTNGMRFRALDVDGSVLACEEFYSIGGGFVITAEGASTGETSTAPRDVPWPFDSGESLLHRCNESSLKIHELVLENETCWRSVAETRGALLDIWHVMETCIRRGLSTEGELPGPLRIARRAAALRRDLDSTGEHRSVDAMARLSAYAIAVNEENAAGHQVVTAPTNGAAGIVPAVLAYYAWHNDSANDDRIVDFLATAGAVGMLYKRNASISGAEMGCQGEVGVACSMAAAGLTAALGGSNEQIENAAEIGMEHNLGLTCDPVGGLVQIPCIERNAMGAVKAVNAAQLALRGNGRHHVTLDQVIATMRQTGLDMASKYKETSLGGLAVNVPSC